jgi:hypothetical protein
MQAMNPVQRSKMPVLCDVSFAHAPNLILDARGHVDEEQARLDGFHASDVRIEGAGNCATALDCAGCRRQTHRT